MEERICLYVPLPFYQKLNYCFYWKLYLYKTKKKSHGREYHIETDGDRYQKGSMIFLEKKSNVNLVLAWKCKYSFYKEARLWLEITDFNKPYINMQTSPLFSICSHGSCHKLFAFNTIWYLKAGEDGLPDTRQHMKFLLRSVRFPDAVCASESI